MSATATAKKTVKIVRKPRFEFPVGVPVNVKVAGERGMRKRVVLVPLDREWVAVHTGRRGRPSHVHVETIERVRAL